jgi:hypothetical protein
MHIKYCKTDGVSFLSEGSLPTLLPFVPLDKRKNSGIFPFMCLSFSDSIKKAKHFVTQTHRMSFSL